MTISRLESISLNNFRSIGGRITVPLNAQVVLIYGANGAGKTSLLSGLEFALTGSIDAMERADPKYREYLVHRGESEADVSVVVQDLNPFHPASSELSFSGGHWGGSQAMKPVDARYFSERCYLAQATLGRLLEIYASKDVGQDSALVRFVNDVLGLDALENLIEGLKQAKDIRNARRLVPGIAELERAMAATREEEADWSAECDRHSAELNEIEQTMILQLSALESENAALPVNQQFSRAAVSRALSDSEVEPEQAKLIELTQFSRQIQAMVTRLAAAKKTPDEKDLPVLEADAAVAARTTTQWIETFGVQIDQILDEARSLFADLASVSETNPSAALASGLDRIEKELRLTGEALSADEAARAQHVELAQAADRDRSRIALVEEQIMSQTEGAAEIARLLAELVPHLHDNECVVCGRDFADISSEPLAAEVSRRASRFSEQAERLSQLSQARTSATVDLSRALSEMNALQSRIMDSSSRSINIAKRAELDNWTERLRTLQEEANRGSRLVSANANARRALAEASVNALTWSETRRDAIELARTLTLGSPAETEPLEEVLRRLDVDVRNRIREAEGRATTRSRLAQLQRNWLIVSQRLDTGRLRQQRAHDRRVELERTQTEIDARRDRARRISRTAETVQQSVIRTVFNENLNSLLLQP